MRARELGLAGKRNRCRNSTAGFVENIVLTETSFIIFRSAES